MERGQNPLGGVAPVQRQPVVWNTYEYGSALDPDMPGVPRPKG